MTSAATQLGSADQATAIALDAISRRGAANSLNALNAAATTSPKNDTLRETVGEFVGNVFYGTLMRQMEKSPIKGKFGHGGRGEDVFQSQLHMEYAKRLGRAPGDPIADRIYEAMTRGRRSAGSDAAKAENSAANAVAVNTSETATAETNKDAK